MAVDLFRGLCVARGALYRSVAMLVAVSRPGLSVSPCLSRHTGKFGEWASVEVRTGSVMI